MRSVLGLWRPVGRFLPAVLVLGGTVVACRSLPPATVTPVRPSASALFFDAWSDRRHGRADTRKLEAAAERALGVEPGWIAPQRFLDEHVHRGALTLPGRYGQYVRSAVDEGRDPGVRARSLYLAGRLGGEAADRRLDRAVRLDPGLSWAWHGIAWRSFSSGDGERAIRAGRRAVRLARDGHELAHFSSSLSRYLSQEDLNTAAQETLAAAIGAEGPTALREEEADMLRASLAGLELESVSSKEIRRGVRRALDTLSAPGLTLAERLTLVMGLRAGPVASGAAAEDEIAFALVEAARSVPPGEEPSALMLLDSTLGDEPTGQFGPNGRGAPTDDVTAKRLAAFRGPLGSGAAWSAVRAWGRALPQAVVDERGVPTRQPLARLFQVLEEADGGADPPPLDGWAQAKRLQQLGGALLGAGWFREARALAEGVIARSKTPDAVEASDEVLGAARELQAGAIEAQAILGGIRALARRIDAREAFVNAGAVGSSDLESAEGDRVDSLRDLSEEIVALFRRYRTPARALPGEGSQPREFDPFDLVATGSPVIKYGPLGKILHPGPSFSAEDQALGRGAQGTTVPGIADLFGRMGRFGLFGQGVGQGGPDATVLRIVGVESRAGEHLGRPFRGTVFWCDGADVPGRFGRLGASISGAALHEGYYVDLSMVRVEHAQWERLRSRFMDRPKEVKRALEAPGARVPLDLRTEVTPALGAADRMRLAVMVEKGTLENLAEVTEAELAHVVAVHEEGHLCDRAAWYPLTFRRVLRLISFAGAHRFRSGRIAQALEERAQLVALAECEDTRLAWIDLLDAAENAGGTSRTPHASAYRRVLEDLVQRFEDEWEAGGHRGLGLDPNVRWIDQLHRIDPGVLRGLSHREAASRGLTGS